MKLMIAYTIGFLIGIWILEHSIAYLVAHHLL
jgi:hypothetical protein